MPLKPLDPVVQEDLCPGWTINALESGRSTEGLKAHIALYNGTPKHSKTINVGDDAAQQALATIYANHTGLPVEDLLAKLLYFITQVEYATRLRDTKKPPTPQEERYEEDGAGLWLVKQLPQGTERLQLTNFTATIVGDVLEDDGTPDTKRFFDINTSANYEKLKEG